jgi:hypothetical protein
MVFFDFAGIAWEYRPEIFIVKDEPFAPDFLLPEYQTWVRVITETAGLNLFTLFEAGRGLPITRPLRHPGPTLLILRDVPAPHPVDSYLAHTWAGLSYGLHNEPDNISRTWRTVGPDLYAHRYVFAPGGLEEAANLPYRDMRNLDCRSWVRPMIAPGMSERTNAYQAAYRAQFAASA